MPITIGNDASGYTSDTWLSTESHRLLSKADMIGVLPATEQFTSIGAYFGNNAGNELEIGIYDITGLSAPYDTAELIYATTLTATSTDDARITEAISPGVGVAGNTYAIGSRAANGNVITKANFTSSGCHLSVLNSTNALQDPWDGSGSTATERPAHFAISEVSASASVTQADTTPEDGVQQSVTSTGLTVAYTASTLAGKAITFSNSDPTTASTYTLDVSAVEASEGMPRIGETSTLSVTATGGTATTDVVIQPKTGWTAVTLAGTLDKAANGFLATLDSDLGVTSAVGDIIYYSNARGEVITATGVYTGGTTVAFQSTEFVIQQGGSATTTATSEGGAFFPFGEGDTPDQFTFTDQTGLELSALTESNTITVLGVTPATDFLASITGGEYAVDSGSGFGAFTSSNTNVQLNYDVKVRNTTSGSYSTAVNTALTIASTSDTFTTTTRAQLAPVLAATKSFSRRINQASTGVIVPTGGDTPTSYSNPAGADGAQYTINSSGVWERTVNNPTVESEVFTTTATNAAGTSDAITVTVNYTSSGIPATKFRRFPWQGYNPL